MPVITLPDGSTRSFASAVSVIQVAEDIGPGLAKATHALENYLKLSGVFPFQIGVSEIGVRARDVVKIAQV